MTAENTKEISKIFDNIVTTLKKNHIDNPENESKIIISYASGKKNFNFISETDINIDKINSIVEKRLEGKPLAKIINQKGFWNDVFYTNEDTLDPRADSEILVESILDDYGFMKTIKFKFIDLCSGTGCLGLSLLGELSNSHCLFIDISHEALKVNKINSNQLNLDKRSTFLVSDLLSDSSLKLNNIEFIVSNPPYIKSLDIKKLNFETLHDPLLSLDGGVDGCDFYRSIILQLKNLKYKGCLYLEIDPIVKGDVIKLVLDNGANILYIKQDYLKNDRLIKITFL